MPALLRLLAFLLLPHSTWAVPIGDCKGTCPTDSSSCSKPCPGGPCPLSPDCLQPSGCEWIEKALALGDVNPHWQHKANFKLEVDKATGEIIFWNPNGVSSSDNVYATSSDSCPDPCLGLVDISGWLLGLTPIDSELLGFAVSERRRHSSEHLDGLVHGNGARNEPDTGSSPPGGHASRLSPFAVTDREQNTDKYCGR